MADTRKKLPSFTSPKGVFKFPKLTEPDYGNNDYPKPDGEYSVKLILEQQSAETLTFLAKLEPLWREAIAQGEDEFAKLKVDTRKKLREVKVNDLFTVIYDKDTEEQTGEIEFKFAMAASGEVKKGPKAGKKWEAKPAIFDAKGRPMVKVPAIWGGTLGRISFEAAPYFIPGTGAAGLKLRLKAAQIIELRQGGNRSASEYGFGQEDGYEYSEPRDEHGFDDESQTDGDAAGEDDADF